MTKQNTRPQPPKTLSAAIRLGLADLAKVENDKRYTVRMSVWHEPWLDGKCAVCLAGAVMAKTLGTPLRERLNPSCSSYAWEDVLNALNAVVESAVEDALEYMDQGLDDVAFKYANECGADVPDYAENPEGFRRELLRVAAWLEERGV